MRRCKTFGILSAKTRHFTWYPDSTTDDNTSSDNTSSTIHLVTLYLTTLLRDEKKPISEGEFFLSAIRKEPEILQMCKLNFER